MVKIYSSIYTQLCFILLWNLSIPLDGAHRDLYVLGSGAISHHYLPFLSSSLFYALSSVWLETRTDRVALVFSCCLSSLRINRKELGDRPNTLAHKIILLARVIGRIVLEKTGICRQLFLHERCTFSSSDVSSFINIILHKLE